MQELEKESSANDSTGMSNDTLANQGYLQSPAWARLIIDFEDLSQTFGTPINTILLFIQQQAHTNPLALFQAVEQFHGDLEKYCRHEQLHSFWRNFPIQGINKENNTFENTMNHYLAQAK